MTDLSVVNSRYRLQDKLGEGGMGVVYRAIDRLTGQTVALKQVTVAGDHLQFASKSTDQDVSLSLAQEFRTLAGLRHPHIVSVLDYGFRHQPDQRQQPYFTMQLIEGAQTLTEYASGLAITDKVRVLSEMLQALAYLHRRGIIHRDLKPANVLVTPEGVVKVMDFGLALHQTESVTNLYDGAVGTLTYMAPEILADEAATVRSDLYAVGVMMYELFAGKHPFNTRNMAALVTSILNDRPDTTMLDFELAEVLDRLLAKAPSERFDRADTVIEALCKATGQPVPAENAALRDSFLQAAKFVGRETELEQLTAALDAAIAGSGSSWLVGGESGVGKSRLLDELRSRALVKGAVVLRGQGVEGGGLPYQLWREPLRRLTLSTEISDLEAGVLKLLVPDISDLLERHILDAPELPGESGQQRLILTIVNMFKRQQIPVVLLLEDLQWTAESLAPIKRLKDLNHDLKLLIVSTYRDEEQVDFPTELSGMQFMKLARLSDSAIGELSESMLGEIGRQERILNLLKRETEGNTFFMVEVVRALAEEAGQLGDIGRITLPEKMLVASIEQAIERRISRVSQTLQHWLQQAALVGRQIDLKIMQQLLELPDSTQVSQALPLDDFLTICTQAAVLEYSEDVWRFSHDKIRDYVITRVPPDELPKLHRRVAVAIETAYPDDSLYAQTLVEHWYQAGEFVQAASYVQPAAELLFRSSNYREARLLVERGLTLTDAPARQVELYHLRGNIDIKLSNYNLAEEAFQRSLAISDTALSSAVALHGLAIIAWRYGQHESARDYARRSLEFARSARSKNDIADNLDTFGIIALHEGDFSSARDYLEQAIVIYREIGVSYRLGVCLDHLGSVHASLGDYALASQYHLESLEIEQNIGSREGIGSALTNLGAVAGNTGDMSAARNYFEQALVIQRETGNLYSIAMNLMNLGVVSTYLEDYPQAQRYLDEALLIQREAGEQHSVALTLVNLVTVCLKSGQEVSAGYYIHEMVDVARAINAVPVLLVLVAVMVDAYIGRLAKLDEMALWAGLVLAHPSTLGGVRAEVENSLPKLEAALGIEALTLALERGKTLDLDAVVQQILTEYGATQA
ncbi:MAG TPA: protein kinase [Phototrophicaceae bacterium]|jgi:tetratricopeptide (TPR) repeat protein|nr:protein kinase [Phototrophicaceae bacterium]